MIEVKISKPLNYEQGVEKSTRTNKVKRRIHNMRGAVRTLVHRRNITENITTPYIR